MSILTGTDSGTAAGTSGIEPISAQTGHGTDFSATEDTAERQRLVATTAGQTHDEGMRSLTPGSERSGVIDFAGDTDRIRLDLQPGTYLLSLRGTGGNPLIDPYLTPVNNGLAHDDDGGTGTNSLLTFTITQAGIYTFDVGAYPDSDWTGGYTVHLERMGTDSVPGNIHSTVEATVDGTTLGFFETANDSDYYHVTLEAGTYYSFDLAAGVDYETDFTGPGEVDTYVSVYNANGTQVLGASSSVDDDHEARGGFVATTSGDYYVQVRSTSGHPRTGYELHIEATPLSEASPLDAIDWGGPANVAQDGPLDDGVFYVYFAAAGEVADGATSLGWTAYERQRAMAALNTFSQFSDVTFAVTTDRSQATFTLVTVRSDEFLGTFNPPGTANAGVGQFSITGMGWDRNGSTGGLEQGGYGFATLVHEFGHGLGLAHPHDDGGGSDVMLGVTGAFDSYGLHALNQAVHTVMSYNDGWPLQPGSYIGWLPDNLVNYAYAGTPMALDIAVLQAKYGAVARNAGNTTYVLPGVNAQGTYFQSIWDTGGTDTIRYDGERNTHIDLTAATLDYSATGGGVVSYVSSIAGGFTIAHGVTIENVRGGSGGDRVIGNEVANVLRGNAGNDVLSGMGGNDRLLGGDHFDSLDGGAGNDVLSGESAADILDGGDGADRLDGSDGDDRLDGGGDADRLYGGVGDDTLEGGSGDDTLVGDVGKDSISGGEGTDSLNGGDGNDVLRGGTGGDRLVGGLGHDSLYGDDGDDTLSGGDGNDTVMGGAGADTMVGGLGNDVYEINDAGDRVVEAIGQGIDSVVSSFSYVLPRAIENGGLSGTAAINLTGNAHDNVLSGNQAANVIDGRAGADTMRGGAGNDTYYVDDANDLVYEVEGAGTDTVFSSVSYVLRESPPPPPGYDPYAGASYRPWYDGENQIERLVLLGSADLSATGNTSANAIDGNAGANAIGGGEGNDTLSGLAGADTLSGGAGEDWLLGGSGDDVLNGGGDADRLSGGAGRDRLIGGGRADVFEFDDGDAGATRALADIITDFSQADGDRLHLGAIDANASAGGDQAFAFLGAGGFTGAAGQLHYVHVDAYTYVEGDLNGDGAADFSIRLSGLIDLTAADFVL